MASEIPFAAPTFPALISPLWFSFDVSEEDKELWLLEQEMANDLERVEQKHSDLYPVGKSANETFADEEDEEDEEEDDNDDEESESHDDDDDEDIDMETEDQDSPAF